MRLIIRLMLCTNQTKIICLALYMQNYRWSKYDAIRCIVIIRLSNLRVLKWICMQGLTSLLGYINLYLLYIS
jgi:hypothetical protein